MAPEYTVRVDSKNSQKFEEIVRSVGGEIITSDLSPNELDELVEKMWSESSSRARNSLTRFQDFLNTSPERAITAVRKLGIDILETEQKHWVYKQDPNAWANSTDWAKFAGTLIAIAEDSLPETLPSERVLFKKSANAGKIVVKHNFIAPLNINLIIGRYGLHGEVKDVKDLAKEYESSETRIPQRIYGTLLCLRRSALGEFFD
jgi:hypothetical protein